ncbi:methionyl-tRNA formyltransferase [Alcanivorax hongdengensis A-11-3]|uniref:Methionyl-tRNA formyltransferase n=1 Tax=Alcanivorax hongdengensis A-11-3 TaxID=1177179 RepID=L0WBB9_9GAMM|nr:methionyl-tRNA formyltransferase [Alcanivorax hongdengensis]EKF74299.1 methionyl-tRNA formyltransferase [Alcanivorax hongdengensis A-11-3]
MTPLRLAFAGTPDFAAASLQAVLDSDHQVVAVLTQPDRAAGRGKRVQKSPVKQLAEAHGIDVLQPHNLKGDDIRQQLRDLQLDALVVVAYGLIIPRAVLDIPRQGCLNVHGSLLPRWRGAAPIQRAITVGDTQTGNTIMQMEAGLDTGPMLLSEALPIGDSETGGQLHDRLAAQGARLLVTVLDDLEHYLANATAQPEDGVTYAHKLSKQEARLDFRLPTRALYNRVRAFNPWPVAWLPLNGQPMRVWQASESPLPGQPDDEPGTLLQVDDSGLHVATGDGVLCLETLQLPGKRAMTVAEVRRGHPDLFQAGDTLGDA